MSGCPGEAARYDEIYMNVFPTQVTRDMGSRTCLCTPLGLGSCVTQVTLDVVLRDSPVQPSKVT